MIKEKVGVKHQPFYFLATNYTNETNKREDNKKINQI
jgi:hypothetical protein